MIICLEQGADLHMTQLMPLPVTISCCSKSRLVYLSVPAHPGSPRQNQEICKMIVVVVVVDNVHLSDNLMYKCNTSMCINKLITSLNV